MEKIENDYNTGVVDKMITMLQNINDNMITKDFLNEKFDPLEKKFLKLLQMMDDGHAEMEARFRKLYEEWGEDYDEFLKKKKSEV